MLQTKRIRISIALATLLLVSGPTLADHHESAGAGDPVNVLLRIEIDGRESSGSTAGKVYEIVVVSGGPGSKLLSGSRVPFPTSVEDTDGDDDGGTTYVYQNIGFTIEAHAWVLSERRVKLAANLEDSFIEVSDKGQPPTVQTRQLSVNAVIREGKPLEVTRVEGEEGSGAVTIEAKILD